ncbi:energy coupling factor transporter S component ThiW [Neobacillus sp. MER 74]|uniref:energy coupling factor transporter S component ThiW n=1 Tax=Bacillaceae TaxID=186817 RepID=UPI000BF5F916|nr:MULTISPECIES: energy coupling factor transporter S component ThiW [Bacillaceae]MCM3117456.1 energy coupling factor transporter S component ThiW [Neobacillus sp. MER 74]PFP25869.1 energy coupling factor transporter S component ThiW [Bacillus sp. AFS073361]
MNKTRKLTLTAMMIAIGTLTSNLFYIPIGFTKVFPIQHFMNVISAVLLGPYYAVAQAFGVSLLRNLLGTGSLFAFPGSMVGALLASLLFWKTRKLYLALIGEVIGTGILGAMLSYPIATLFLGQKATLFGFIPLFIFSSFAGALLGFLILTVFLRKKVLIVNENDTTIRN